MKFKTGLIFETVLTFETILKIATVQKIETEIWKSRKVALEKTSETWERMGRMGMK